MWSFVLEWLNILVRWAHLVVGIGWIGASFYFVALDLRLRRRANTPDGVSGTAWQVHGGGFYHVEKYTVAPDGLPDDLIWYRWEAYLTWVTGFLLLILQYYFNADAYLISRAVQPLLPGQAIVISLLGLGSGWFVYDWICRSRFGQNTLALAIAVFAMILLASWAFGELFSGRGALIHVGAFIGTIMAVNVFGVIIPNQRKITASLLAGKAPDPRLGAMGKQRSMHNNYLTLPVLILMVSNHYPVLTGHDQIWLVVALIVVGGAAVRHFINRHEAGDAFASFAWALPVVAAALAAALWLTAPRVDPAMAGLEVGEGEALTIVATHCAGCHAERPANEAFDAPPKGVVLTSLEDLERHADGVMAQAVRADTMPLGNETGMREAERQRLGAFLLAR